MANHGPLEIANEFLKLAGGPMDQMKLQKLVYMAHGWNLAINDEPLVNGAFEAWDGGPVMRSIWNHIRDCGFDNETGLLSWGKSPWGVYPFRSRLSSDEKAVIEKVWARYGRYTGLQLSEMTHRAGTPWSNAYFGRGRNGLLDNTDIKQHFTDLAFAGRSTTAA